MSTLPTLFRDVDEILERLGNLSIDNNDQFEEAGEFLNKIALTEKAVKNYYEEDRASAYAVYQGVLSDIKKFTTPLGKAANATKAMMNRYLRSTQVEEPDDTETIPETQPPTSTGTSTYDVWSYEVVDISKVSPEFLVVDDGAVRKVVQDMHELAEGVVGGIKVTKETRVKPKGR